MPSNNKPKSIDPAGKELHKGYNEKNPSQSQGSFTSNSLQEGELKAGKKKSVLKIKKRVANRTNKK